MTRRLVSVALAVGLASLTVSTASFAEEPPPLKALLISGGCCHEYPEQAKVITEELKKRIRIEFTVVAGDDKRESKIELYNDKDWAKGYDVVVHNECYGGVTDVPFVEGIAKAHFDGTPGVVIHCSMHSYRNAETDEWRKCVGVTSRSHEGKRALEIKLIKPEHPILTGFPDGWKTPNGELYKIEKVWETATPLAKAYGADTKMDHVVIWTNTYGKGRIFGTTLGHHTVTMVQEEYLGMLTRGLLWACGKLEDDGTTAKGYAAAKPAEAATPAEKPAEKPEDQNAGR